MPLAQPTVTASDASQGVILAWGGVPTATYYEIRWSNSSADCYSGTLISGQSSPYAFETEYYGKDHFFSVTAANSSEISDPSSAIEGKRYMIDWNIHINDVNYGTLLCIKKIGDNLFGGTDTGKVITKTCCGTANWTQLGNDCAIPDIYSITHDSSNDILIVAGTVDGSNRTVAYTTDSGDSWNYLPTIGNGPGTQNEIDKDGLFFNNGLLYIAGRQGYSNPSDKYGSISGWGYRHVIWVTSDYTNVNNTFESSYYKQVIKQNFAEDTTINRISSLDTDKVFYFFENYYDGSRGFVWVNSGGSVTWGGGAAIYLAQRSAIAFKHAPNSAYDLYYLLDVVSWGVFESSIDTLYHYPFKLYDINSYRPKGADIGYNDYLFLWTTSDDNILWWCHSDAEAYNTGNVDVFSGTPNTSINALLTTSGEVYAVGLSNAGITADWHGAPYQPPVTSTNLRVLWIGDSEYSDRVLTWPKINRKANNFQSVNVTVVLDNNSADLNLFYNEVYSIPQTVKLEISDPSTDFDLQTIYTGYLKKVKYSDNKCILTLKDKLFDFYQKTIGDNNDSVEFDTVIPSDMLWTICTSYGGLSDEETTSNTDIDYQSFLDIAHTFSYDNITCSGRFAGVKISEALTDFVKMTNCLIYTERDGRLTFKNFLKEQTSESIHLDTTKYNNFDIDIDTKRVINKQHVYFDYNVSSNDWESAIFREEVESQDSYGLYENTLKSDKVWLNSSVDANIIADQILLSYKNPPTELTVKSTLYAREYEIGDAISLTNSFYALDSDTKWRITEYIFDMSNGSIIFTLDGASLNTAFYLDVSNLDGNDLLL